MKPYKCVFSLSTSHRRQAQNAGVSMATNTSRSLCGVGFSFALDKIVNFLGHVHDDGLHSVDVAVCTTGVVTKEVPLILRTLWMLGVRTGLVEESDIEEAQDVAQKQNVPHIILLGERGSLCVRSWKQNNEFSEKYLVSRQELPDHIQKLLCLDHPGSAMANTSGTANTSSNNDSNSSQAMLNVSGGGGGGGGGSGSGGGGGAAGGSFSGRNLAVSSSTLCGTEVSFSMPERLTVNLRRRYESLAMQNLTPILSMFVKKEFVHIVVVSLGAAALRAFAGSIDIKDCNMQEAKVQMNLAMEMFPKDKRKMQMLYDDVLDLFKSRKDPPIIILYSFIDSFYKIIL